MKHKKTRKNRNKPKKIQKKYTKKIINNFIIQNKTPLLIYTHSDCSFIWPALIDLVNKNVEFGNFFRPFQKFGPVILTYLLTAVAYVVACVPLIIFGGIAFFNELLDARTDPTNFNPIFTTALLMSGLVTFVLVLLVATFTYYATYFAYFYDVKPMEAIKLSIKMGTKNFGHLIMLFLFSGFIAVIGVLLCGVGLLVTIPLSHLIKYYTFEGLTKLEK